MRCGCVLCPPLLPVPPPCSALMSITPFPICFPPRVLPFFPPRTSAVLPLNLSSAVHPIPPYPIGICRIFCPNPSRTSAVFPLNRPSVVFPIPPLHICIFPVAWPWVVLRWWQGPVQVQASLSDITALLYFVQVLVSLVGARSRLHAFCRLRRWFSVIGDLMMLLPGAPPSVMSSSPPLASGDYGDASSRCDIHSRRSSATLVLISSASGRMGADFLCVICLHVSWLSFVPCFRVQCYFTLLFEAVVLFAMLPLYHVPRFVYE